MSNQSVGNRVQQELSQSIKDGLLPDNVKDKAAQLLLRLQQPVRLALIGLPGSGKSTLLNLLVGSNVLPDGVRLPTLQLSYGAQAQSICTLPDGSKKTLSNVDGMQIAAQSPVFVEMQIPLPALKKISVLEVVTPSTLSALQRATQWAAKRCDIALWCTQHFTAEEQQTWAKMPDLVKDHAFLMLTQADVLQSSGQLDEALAALKSVAEEEFNQILPIATINAIAARKPDGSVDKDKMRQSGGLGLISAVLRQVEQGKQSTVDMAEVLLRQHTNAQQQPEPVAAPQTPTEKTSAGLVGSVMKSVTRRKTAEAANSKTPVVDASDGISRLRIIAQKKAAERSKVVSQPPPPQAETLKPSTREAYEHVIAYMEEQSRALSDALTDMGESAPTKIMEMAVEHMQWLSDYLNENGDDSDETLLRARDAAFDASDLVQLMQMEKRDSAALEAVSLMLQIKRELQADLAA